MNNPLVQPDPGLFIWTIATFLVLLFLLTKFAWKPLLQALDARQQDIRKSLEDAQRAKEDFERLKLESETVIRNAHVEAQAVVARTREDAERLRETLKKQAREESEQLLRAARRQIEGDTRQAIAEVRREAVELAVQLASKLLQRNLTADDNARLIEDTLGQIEKRVH